MKPLRYKALVETLLRSNDFYSDMKLEEVPTNSDEFNAKYKQYLEEGHYGMSFDSPFELLLIMDWVFQNFATKFKNFHYSQIKWKFGASRFYSTLPHYAGYIIEGIINTIVWSSENKRLETGETLDIDQSTIQDFYIKVVEAKKNNTNLN